MNSRIGPAEKIFLALADLGTERREAFLREHCGDDARLRAEVDALLAAVHAPDDDFLDPAGIPALDLDALDGPLQPGTTLCGYLVLHAIGAGGMGVVYAAQQDRPRRLVAIKVLRRGLRRPEVLARFAREADVLGRLHHPGIAQVHAFHPGGRGVPAHLVMELIDGLPITEYAQAHALTPAARIDQVVLLCDAVQHAHDRGVVHRDLKPANVLVSGGRPRVLDFGIARATGLDVHSGVRTLHGQLLGTLAYMSPEQLRGATSEVDARSDVYAVGVLLFRLLSGRLPYDVAGLPLAEAVHLILQGEPPRLDLVDGAPDPALASITARAMARDPARRHSSAADLGRDLVKWREGRFPAPHAAMTDSPVFAAPLVATSGDGRLVAVGLAGGPTVVLDAATGATVARAEGRAQRVIGLRFGDDGRLLVSREDGSVERVATRR